MKELHPSSSSPSSQRHGVMVVVVGPSGAGKDTLMEFAAARLGQRPNIHFARRVITRRHGAGGEDHDAVTQEEFDRRLSQGEFSVSWQAHGLSYGIPTSVHDTLRRGDIVIANGSRSALGHFRSAFPVLKVVNVIATPDVLAARLESRGRESRDDILRRLQRSSLDVCGDFDVTTIDNSGRLDVAGAAFGELLEEQLGHCR
jgi:ribose 1,5-bisphosphokinase